MNTLRLSPSQRRVVDHGEGPLVVEAGPGSGKTRVLTERVRRLLTQVPGHFRILALTFTNKAANEMAERLADLGDVRQRATISTMHGFCLEMLQYRGHFIGISGELHIFELAKDRKQILLEAAMDDPVLSQKLLAADTQSGGRSKLLDQWLRKIAIIKAHPLTQAGMEDPIIKSYDAGLRACGAFDFDDLLLLTYRLLTEFPKIADLYGRIYDYICIDEAQDLNEAQYAVLVALCGDSFRNVMMVGDPKQSIYGFNTASPKYMQRFQDEFNAVKISLNENFRSSQVVVDAAKRLNQQYVIDGQSGCTGEIGLDVGRDEAHEATKVCDQLESLFAKGHRDVENGITPSQCAVLGRNHYVLIAVEKKLQERDIPCYKRRSSPHEYESSVIREFHLALRVHANPRDWLHMNALAKEWNIDHPSLFERLHDSQAVSIRLRQLAEQTREPRHEVIVSALDQISRQTQNPISSSSIEIFRQFADTLDDEERRAIYEDTQVLLDEWDRYLRTGTPTRTIAGFLSSMALGTTRQTSQDGVALLSVHAAKGLEFDVVFMVGMADGIFPDYRAKGDQNALDEEQRNAFVAVTRSRRLLYFSYAQTRMMPWGETWNSRPSPYLRLMGFNDQNAIS
ncbi:MAG: ATP-dependent helicase [Magnetococcales bacterium]|nr:ATP-dependent helicase [Magnetococcales bacterium]